MKNEMISKPPISWPRYTSGIDRIIFIFYPPLTAWYCVFCTWLPSALVQNARGSRLRYLHTYPGLLSRQRFTSIGTSITLILFALLVLVANFTPSHIASEYKHSVAACLCPDDHADDKLFGS